MNEFSSPPLGAPRWALASARSVFVPPPHEDARKRIVEMKLAGVPHESIDARAIALSAAHFSCADIDGVVKLAKDFVLQEYVRSGQEGPIRQEDLHRAARSMQPSTLDWQRTARNRVKYAGADASYGNVERSLKTHKLI
jgi:SpoVK/Ycf46/Vps4 family AAA+-type ATPase